MMSKKDVLTLGVLAIGGVAVASSFAGGGDTGALESKKGGILGSQQDYSTPTIYQLPAQAAVTFPEAPKFDIGSFLDPKEAVSRGTQGVSSAGKKTSVRPYLYTGGEVKAGAVSIAPWAMGRTTPAEIGVTTALKMATTKKAPITKKKEITGRAASPGRMGYGKSYAAAHGGA